MGEKKEHLKKLSELSEKIMTLSESIRQAEKDMGSVWTDEIEMKDLRNVKERMKAVEETLVSFKKRSAILRESTVGKVKQDLV